MGIRLFSSCSNCEPVSENTTESRRTAYSNPDPSNFVIEKIESVGKFIIVRIYYPDSTNFEGKKIVVYKDRAISEIIQATKLDPHFCDDKNHISPIARFEPTNRGWRYAVSFCKNVK